jgi:hypothetical protein
MADTRSALEFSDIEIADAVATWRRPGKGLFNMIIGAHSILYSANAEADRAFFRDVLKLGNIEMGDGWLIFALPPSEVAFHPADESGKHEFYLMCASIEGFVSAMEGAGLAVTPISDQGWGLLAHVTLPGGGELGVYQPTHPRPAAVEALPAKSAKPRAKKTAKKAATKSKKAATKAPAKGGKNAAKASPAKTKKPAKKPPMKQKTGGAPAKKKKKK